MRRLLVLFLICLLPLQVSWAAVSDYCGHGPDGAVQHFGHHDDELHPSGAKLNSDKPLEQFDIAHDHCHMCGFIGLVHQFRADTTIASPLPSLRSEEITLSSPALVRPERPKWYALA